MIRRHLILLIALIAAQSLGAQQPQPRGRIEGEIVDSVHSRPLGGAFVVLTRLLPAPSQFFSATTDARGRFHFDTLAGGQYSVGFSAAMLDSLDLTLPPRELALAEGEAAHVVLATPSGATFRTAACLGLILPPGKGAVVGSVVDADSEKPAAGVRVVVQWTELSVNRETLRNESVPRIGAVTTDSLGQYRLCGVPTNERLIIELQTEKVAGAEIETVVDDSIGVAKRDLSLSVAESHSLADSSAAASTDALLPPLTGTATLTGTVRTLEGTPIAGARVRVVDAASTAVTDSAGRFELARLPAGTQTAEIRRLGFTLHSAQAELRRGRATELNVRLTRFTSLDSVRIVAQRTKYRDFEQERHFGQGTYLNEEQIAKHVITYTSDLLRGASGMIVMGDGVNARVISRRGTITMSGVACDVNVIIDGFEHMDINMVEPTSIGAMAIYSGATVPMPYATDSPCGAVIIWTKK